MAYHPPPSISVLCYFRPQKVGLLCFEFESIANAMPTFYTTLPDYEWNEHEDLRNKPISYQTEPHYWETTD